MHWRLVGAACLMLQAAAAAAQMYKCVDAKGVTQYSDKPCMGGKGGEVDIRGQPPISGKVAPQGEDLKRQEREFQSRQRQRDREDEKRLRAAAQKQKRCDALRADLKRASDQPGTRSTGDARAARISRLNQQIAQQC